MGQNNRDSKGNSALIQSAIYQIWLKNMDKALESWQLSDMQNQTKLNVKICGLKTIEAVGAALNGGASHIGFIFFEKSPRNITPEQAAVLRNGIAGKAKIVAVTVNAGIDFLDRIVKFVEPDILQLHGNETPELVGEIKARYGLPVMKAFAIRTLEDMQASNQYAGIADMFLFDAKPPEGSDLPGGNGVSFDWQLLTKFTTKTPIMLSGGLNRENIAEAMLIAKPQGVDISSGVEASPGVKDIELISQFLDELKKFQNCTKTA